MRIESTINPGIKVLLANKFFFLKGGSERVFFQEREFLSRNGVNIVDFSMHDPKNLPSNYSHHFVSHIDYHCEQSRLKRFKNAVYFIHSFEAVRNLRRLLREERPEIAHLHNIYHQLTPSIITILKKNGVKVILTLHDGKLICPSYLMLDRGDICTACEGGSFWKLFTRNCSQSRVQGLLLMLEGYWHKWIGSYEKVDVFISPSRFLAQLVSQRVPRAKVEILPNGIDINGYSPSNVDESYALYFGRLSKEKGIESLLKAQENLARMVPLKVVGSGPLEKQLREEYPNSEFLGYKQGEELKQIISKSAFVVVPSEWYENCSMVVLEAMALGKPVIGSRIGGIPEQIDDGKTGFLYETGNVEELASKMLLLYENSSLRQRMGSAARKKLEQEYSLDAHCQKLIRIYEELVVRNES